MSEKTGAVRTYTESLERTLNTGVELRDEMRRKIDSLSVQLRIQKGMLNAAVAAKELYQKRLGNYKKRLVSEREKRQKVEGKLQRLMRNLSDANRPG